MSEAKQNVTYVPFNSFAKQIVSAHKASDKANAKMRDVIQIVMQQFVDANLQANGRTEDACKALAKQVRESETAKNSVALGVMEAKTWTEYAQSAQRALYWAVPFEAGLKNDTEKKLPWSKKATNQTTAAGRTTSTNRTELDKTLSKALQQARLLGLTEFAASVLDVCIERLEGFKETEAK